MSETKHILLVEDDDKDLELTLTALESYNLANDVDVAHDGEEALNYLYRHGKFQDRTSNNPVVVLLDLKMPKVGGLEVLRQIKSDDNLNMIPVVVLTSSKEDVDIKECYRLGVNAYVVKPVKFHEFIEAIKKLGLFWLVLNEPPPESKEE